MGVFVLKPTSPNNLGRTGSVTADADVDRDRSLFIFCVLDSLYFKISAPRLFKWLLIKDYWLLIITWIKFPIFDFKPILWFRRWALYQISVKNQGLFKYLVSKRAEPQVTIANDYGLGIIFKVFFYFPQWRKGEKKR